MVRTPRGGLVTLPILGSVAATIFLAACSGAYKEGVELRTRHLPGDDARLYAHCIAKKCEVAPADVLMEQVIEDAELACLVDTDKGTSRADSAACQCSQSPDATQKAACEKWMNYVPLTVSVDAGVCPQPVRDGGADAA